MLQYFTYQQASVGFHRSWAWRVSTVVPISSHMCYVSAYNYVYLLSVSLYHIQAFEGESDQHQILIQTIEVIFSDQLSAMAKSFFFFFGSYSIIIQFNCKMIWYKWVVTSKKPVCLSMNNVFDLLHLHIYFDSDYIWV